MDRVKIQEIADEAGASNAVLIEKAKELGYDVKVASSTVTVDEAGILVDYVINGIKPKIAKKPKMKVVKKAKVTKSADVNEEITSTEEADVALKEVKEEAKVEEKKVAEEKTPAVKPVKKKSSRMSGSITATPKKKKIEIVEVVKEEETTVKTVSEPSTAEAVTATEENVEKEKVETTPEPVSEVKTEESASASSDEPITTEDVEPVKEKSKMKRKRIGITVIKKADRDKPRIRIIEENRPIGLEKSKKPKGMPTPPSKKKIKKIATAKESGEKLNFMTNSSFGGYGRNQVTEVEEEPEIMMLDFSDKNIYEDMMRQEAKRKEEAKKRAAGVGGQQQNRGDERAGQRRVSLLGAAPFGHRASH